jgi:hypothetical protein
VAKVDDGWLVGFDAGEFGGGLWWFSPDGGRFARVRAPENAARADDIYKAENVRGLVQVGSDQLVLMGLDHMGGRSGRVFRASKRDGAWKLDPRAVLDGSADAWAVLGDRLLVLTDSGLWEVIAGTPARQVHRADTGGLYPTSMVRAGDGAFYVGMRRYILRLEAAAGAWRETWLVASNCVRARVTNFTCECVP